ncbi:MAG: DNA mismatch repair protein [Deltaproteobacteria bacterium]|nr:DNA mismatch repair protein [Deltaproteobacteria bacterium]
MSDSFGSAHTVAPAPDKLAPYLPDLLHGVPSVALDHAKVCRSLCIAFSTGDAEQSLERIMDDARMCPSSWGGSSFHEGLYMNVLVSHCMKVTVGGQRPKTNMRYLLRLLDNPPSDAPTREFRRTIIAELVARPDLRADFEATYVEIHKLRTELQALDNVGYYDSRVRRLFVLSLLRDLMRNLQRRFDGATSGLSRITAYANYVAQTEGFGHLCDLLEYEEQLSNVQFKMRLGADGSLRRFEIVDVQENRGNRFYQGPLRRFLAKFGLWVRGYRIGESGLLDAWLEEVFNGMVPYVPAVLRLLGEQEFYLAGLSFRDQCQRQGLATSFPIMLEPDAPAHALKVEGLFNPLLFTQGSTPVPCGLDGEAIASKAILTGPNSGGKTRLLQALGITQVLAEAGLYAPVASATIPRANGLFVSLVEEGTVDQSEGRLGMELLRIRRLFEHAQVGSLVILDELCSGTNPSEGEEIFLLVLSLLEDLDARSMVATHFLDFARRLQHETRADDSPLRLAFLQVDVGANDLPTYQFRSGVAQTSMAQQTAARLGVTDSVLRALVHRQRLAAPETSRGGRIPPPPFGVEIGGPHGGACEVTELFEAVDARKAAAQRVHIG